MPFFGFSTKNGLKNRKENIVAPEIIEIVKKNWAGIKEKFRQDYNLTFVSYNTWIEPLQVGGMTKDGRFEFTAEGLKSSPSEEFNRTMATYTGAFVQLARLAAAMYSPAAASIPLTTEAADPAAVAKLVDAQSAAKSAEITAKSQKQTALIKAQSDAKIAEQNAAAANAAECTDCVK